ncbi:MAG: methionine adenosyltransferase [Candidatus Eremiobacteraeota bacterium]|nr:methionine adenosyltransferase [Candidatus Eremiobacteraeota bacterium]
MEMERFLFTSESVTEGHPDKVADQISDAILDDIMTNDPMGRVAVETFVHTGCVHVGGQITTQCYTDIPKIVRNVVREIGYTESEIGFDADTCGVLVSIDEQSPDIALGVNKAFECKEANGSNSGAACDDIEGTGAGDQGIMFGYACRETEEYMPLPITLAHKLCRKLSFCRRSEILPFLRPDGKSQVTIEYDQAKPVRIDSIVVSAHHKASVDTKTIREGILEKVINEVVPKDLMDDKTKIYINPTGRFVVGGPVADTGLTGRKIIVDTYGGMAHHGGGCFSGKDPTKVDRSACYAARYVAKNVVAAGLADRCEVAVAYAIGVAHPVSVSITTYNTHHIPKEKILELIHKNFDLRPGAIIRDLGLRKPIFRQVACYGHFGRHDLDLPWERLDKVDALRKGAGLPCGEPAGVK